MTFTGNIWSSLWPMLGVWGIFYYHLQFFAVKPIPQKTEKSTFQISKAQIKKRLKFWSKWLRGQCSTYNSPSFGTTQKIFRLFRNEKIEFEKLIDIALCYQINFFKMGLFDYMTTKDKPYTFIMKIKHFWEPLSH